MSTNLTTKFIKAAPDTNWTGCNGACGATGPNIAVVVSGGRVIIAAESMDQHHVPAIVGHLALAGIRAVLLTSVHAMDIQLTAAAEHYDEIIRILHEAGADLTVVDRQD